MASSGWPEEPTPEPSCDSAAGPPCAELNARGTTIIVITHDHAVAARMRRRIEMLDGHITADADAHAVPRTHDDRPGG